MSLKKLVIAALFAAYAVARPAEDKKRGKEYTPGWCTFHLHEDASASGIDGRPKSDKIEVKFFDGNKEDPDNWYTYPQTEIPDYNEDGSKNRVEEVRIKPPGFDDPIVLSRPERGGWIPHWHFKFQGQDWDTKSGQCSAGGVEVCF